jgi:CheY-like chemotaxis protein
VRARGLPFGAASPSVPFPSTVNPTPLKAIVLVDDESSYAELITGMLAENLDCPVHAFTRPLEALQALPRLDPGVIVTDYFMPQLDGFEFIRQASALVPEASFVLITGHDLSDEQDVMARLTALKGFLPKPFGWRKLADEIIRVWPNHITAPTHRADATSL